VTGAPAEPPAFPEPAVLIGTRAEAGPVRQVIRPGRLNARAVAGWLTAWLLLPVIAGLISLGAHAGLAPFLYLLVIAAVALAPLLAMVLSVRFLVCEHGLVISALGGQRNQFFIPYATIDTASVMHHPVARRGGSYRYKPVALAQEEYPWPPMRDYLLADCPLKPRLSFSAGPRFGSPLNLWRAPHNRHAVSFRALHPVFASPYWRARPPVRDLPARAQWVLRELRRLLRYPELVPVLVHRDQPVMRWMLGSNRPSELLTVIEQAMTAAGVPGAAGFAARALARPYDRPPRDIPADPQLW
jgi:hypothetical protein